MSVLPLRAMRAYAAKYFMYGVNYLIINDYLNTFDVTSNSETQNRLHSDWKPEQWEN